MSLSFEPITTQRFPTMLKRIRHLIVAASVISLLCPAPASAADNAIVIGHAVDLSGANGSIGRDYVAGIKTYFDMVNSSGGIEGKHIRYVVRDDQGQPELSAKAATDLIESEQATYLLGGVGDKAVDAVLSAPAFARSEHVLFAPLATVDHAGSARALFWRPSHQQEIRHILSHFNSLGMNEIGVVYQDSPANMKAYKSLSAETGARAMKLIGTARIGTDGEQIEQEARRLAGTSPGFILVLADTIGTALFLREYRKHGGMAFVAGTSLINLATLRELAGAKAVEWTVFSQVVPNPAAATLPLQAEHLKMMRKFRDEDVSSLTLEGFAVAKALTLGIRQSKHAGPSALREFFERNGSIDLGGMTLRSSGPGVDSRLSDYVDIALFRKGGSLMF